MSELTGNTENESKLLKKVLRIWKTNDKSSSSGLQQQSKEVGTKGRWGKKRENEEDGNTVYLLGRKLSKKLILPNSIEDIVLTSQKLCEEYIGRSSNQDPPPSTTDF